MNTTVSTSSTPLLGPLAAGTWDELRARIADMTPEALDKWKRQILTQIGYEDEAKKRHNLEHLPGWSGKIGRPLLALIEEPLNQPFAPPSHA